MAAYLRANSLKIICGLTVCTPGSAPGPTLSTREPLPLPTTEKGNHMRRQFFSAEKNKQDLKAGYSRVVIELSTAEVVMY